MNPTLSQAQYSAADINALYRRTLLIVVVSQAFGGAGLAAGISVGALIAQDMLGGEALAGVPAACFTLGAAITAFVVGKITQARGRRIGLGAGFLAGGLGAILIIVAAQLDNPWLLFGALVVYGAGTATNLQARYAGTDLAPEEFKGKAVSISMVATTIGAVAGPNLVAPMTSFAERLGMVPLSGPFILSAAAYLLAGLILVVGLRPDPFLVAQQLATTNSAADRGATAGAGSRSLVLVGVVAMVVSQIVMVAIMTMTPVHMRGHHHDIGAVGLVIGLHVAAMWLPSLVTGTIVDKVGARAVAVTGGVVLALAGLLAAFAPSENLAGLIAALMLLGLGWNLGVVSGTTMVVKGAALETRAATQGKADVLVNIGAAGAGIASGLMMSAFGFTVLSIVGGVAALIIVPLVWLRGSHVDQ